MKVHLLYRDRDFDAEQKPPANEAELMQDLELGTLLEAMAKGDKLIRDMARKVIFAGLQEDPETILYRQAILQDCLRHEDVAQELAHLIVETEENKRRRWLGMYTHSASSVLYGAVGLMEMLLGILGKLRHIAIERADGFESEGFRTLFAMIAAELPDDYFARVRAHLKDLRFRHGVLVGAELGPGNVGADYRLLKSPGPEPNWFQRFFLRWCKDYRDFTFRIADRDEAGARILSELQDRGINSAANALAQSVDHVTSFLVALRTELSFYLGCVNLHRQLDRKRGPVCFPSPVALDTCTHECIDLRDVCLDLRLAHEVVGNDLDAKGKHLLVVTGANQGGKSTFLRSIGLAQLMMQAGMFVTAESFSANLCRGIFTHYKREEDASMTSGKFEEELDRMSRVVDALVPHSLVLFNESFAATNEREGSEIARQIVHALLESPVKIFFVTHLYQFAHALWDEGLNNALFLRAERRSGGERTFKLLPGEPLPTSYGADLYEEIFGDTSGPVSR
jgi:hypothetical protein